MVPTRVSRILLAASLLAAGGVSGQERRAVAAASAGIAELAWLAGCWESPGGGPVVEERWSPARGGSMLGTSRTVRGDSLVAWEFLLLRERDGGLVYRAHPSGQAVAEFTASVIGPDSVIFENPDHDFPQRIGYRRDGDALLGWIDGVLSGRPRRAEFPYVRRRCDAGS